jgi:hypothetical protein
MSDELNEFFVRFREAGDAEALAEVISSEIVEVVLEVTRDEEPPAVR